MDDVIFDVLESWSLEWHAPPSSTVEAEKLVAQRKKDEAKLHMAQLVEKWRNEVVAAKAQEACDAAKATKEQQKAVEKDHEGQKSPE